MNQFYTLFTPYNDVCFYWAFYSKSTYNKYLVLIDLNLSKPSFQVVLISSSDLPAIIWFCSWLEPDKRLIKLFFRKNFCPKFKRSKDRFYGHKIA